MALWKSSQNLTPNNKKDCKWAALNSQECFQITPKSLPRGHPDFITSRVAKKLKVVAGLSSQIGQRIPKRSPRKAPRHFRSAQARSSTTRTWKERNLKAKTRRKMLPRQVKWSKNQGGLTRQKNKHVFVVIANTLWPSKTGRIKLWKDYQTCELQTGATCANNGEEIPKT